VERSTPVAAEPKEARLTGQVLGPDGQPVPGAEVGVVNRSREGRKLDELFTVTCDQAGEFVLVTEDASWLGTWWPAHWLFARAAGGALMGAAVVLNYDAAQPAEIRLSDAAYIHATVLGPVGLPLPGIRTDLAAFTAGLRLAEGPLTDERGEADLGPLPAGLPVHVSVPRELRHLVAEHVWDSEEITLAPGETHRLPPLTLDPDGRSIEGTLQDADGWPLPGAQVACYLPVVAVNAATADEHGRFHLTGLPARGYDVWLIAVDGAAQPQVFAMAAVDPDAGEDAALVLRPLTCARGLLTSRRGQPLADVDVRLAPMVSLGPGREGFCAWGAGLVPPPMPVRTAEDGSWQVDGLVAGGVYALETRKPSMSMNLEPRFLEVDLEGTPTDLGPMVIP
jgi:hypothetical protein